MDAAVTSYIDHKLKYGLLERSAISYRSNLKSCFNRLEAAGCCCLPYNIDEDSVYQLINSMRADELSVKTQRNYVAALRGYLEHFNNNVFKKYPIRWPHDTRPTVSWLTREQSIDLASRIFDDEVTNIMIHCELCLGMRRIEVLRLRASDFEGNYVKIRGKGRVAPKIRYMPYHRDTQARLSRYLEWRAKQVEIAKRRRPVSTVVPDRLLIWRRFYSIGAFEEVKAQALNNRLRTAGKEVGIERLSHHMLRRSFGRALWLGGTKIETVAKMMGHESIDQTADYIGVNMDDMNTAMENFIL